MKLKFDPSQQYQLDAINAVVDIFDGQPLNKGDYEISFQSSFGGELLGGQVQTELGVGNNLVLSDEALLANVLKMQGKHDLEPSSSFLGRHFSVEMETGTGKTYVYLRTIFELNQKYGFKKFIIVVPSIAIREGVLKNLQITEDHFRAIYNNPEFEYHVYDARTINKLRQFATNNQIQILIINIDAFRRNFTGTESENKGNLIYRESDRLSGRQPIEYITATKPIVIIDEPQSVDNTEKAQEAIKSLNPLCTLRYSATHKNPFHLVYKLDPIRAFELRLVKQIVVASVTGANAFNDAYVKLIDVDNRNGIRARVSIHESARSGVKEKNIWVKQEDDLFERSNNRENYRNGYIVTEISAEPGNEYIQFDSGKRVNKGQELGGVRDDVARVQIRNTIKRHLDKELKVRDKGIKVLSLFFIDRVANYRAYDDEGNPTKGKYAQWFEEEFKSLVSQDLLYKDVIPFPIDKIHDGYFAQDKKGAFKDSSEGRQTSFDEDVYNKIMKNKEQLLSSEEPLRFIFSHSALREGWDNPNVFQICTLNETRSSMRKRQEIGRGLRLPVNQNGERVFDEAINKLTVIANESYESFAKTLQTEYEDDCGITFGKLPSIAFSKIVAIVDGKEEPVGRDTSQKIWANLVSNGFLTDDGKILPKFNPKAPGFDLALPPDQAQLKPQIIDVMQSYRIERHIKNESERRKLEINKQVFLDPEFEKLWNRIKTKTTYSVQYATEELVNRCVKAAQEMPRISPVKIAYQEFQVGIEHKGVTTSELRSQTYAVNFSGGLPDIIAYLQRETELTRSTIVKILVESGRIKDFSVNPQIFMDSIAAIMKKELHRLIVDGVKYEKIADDEFSMRLFEQKEIVTYLTSLLEVKKSVYDAIEYDSEIEREFAAKLDQREDIKLFVKLPSWFKIETPVGTYNPDWAIVKHNDTTLYLVRETKGTRQFELLRNLEADKIKCGRRHFEELGVDYDVVVSSSEV